MIEKDKGFEELQNLMKFLDSQDDGECTSKSRDTVLYYVYNLGMWDGVHRATTYDRSLLKRLVKAVCAFGVGYTAVVGLFEFYRNIKK